MGPVDAVVDYSVLRAIGPNKVIEIGSGRSTQVLVRAIADLPMPENRLDTEGREIICIDPQPRLSIDGLPVGFLRRTLNEGDVELAKSLEADDVLFIDSSHILQPGTDVDIEFNLIFPELKPGVVVHIHDIFLPFSYPERWEPRGWNEACGLAPWIAAGAFEVLFPTHYMLVERAEEMRAALPDFAPCEPYAGGSFWIRKV